MDDKSDIAERLREAQQKRERLLEQLENSENIIAGIETRLSEVTKSQEARLRADDRVDNKLLDSVQNKKITRTETPLPDSSESKAVKQEQIVPDETSWFEITIDEDGNRREVLRKR
jgi:hypothetical protein